jgi:hypothetical protein
MNSEELKWIGTCLACFFIGLAAGLGVLYLVLSGNPSVEQGLECRHYLSVINQSILANNSSIAFPFK